MDMCLTSDTLIHNQNLMWVMRHLIHVVRVHGWVLWEMRLALSYSLRYGIWFSYFLTLWDFEIRQFFKIWDLIFTLFFIIWDKFTFINTVLHLLFVQQIRCHRNKLTQLSLMTWRSCMEFQPGNRWVDSISGTQRSMRCCIFVHFSHFLAPICMVNAMYTIVREIQLLVCSLDKSVFNSIRL